LEPHQLSERTRQRLISLLADDRVPRGRLEGRLREMCSLEGVPAFSAAVHVLAHLKLPEQEAETVLSGLLDHRDGMTRELGRDPGLRVAAIDYLTNVRPLLVNPAIVEMSQLEMTERSAITDALTQLHNRRYFQSCLDLEVRRSRRYDLDLSLLMMDLDSFKAVNDLYGHPFGDQVLRRAGSLLRRAVRESDIACRFGGEEFAVILPETDRLGAHAVAERVRRKVATGFAERPVDGRIVVMTISGGIASFPEDGDNPAALIAGADQALYHAKAGGKNRITIRHFERRDAVRYPARHSASARLEGDDRTVEVRPVNLSRGGALLATDQPFEPLEAVELVWSTRLEEKVLRGRVIRVEPAAGGEARRLVAVAFDDPASEEWVTRQVTRSRPPRRSDA
jgi:diguanylate cyclase (GGDEF)-like protein